MRRSVPPLNALLAFESAARHGNFTRAAEDLGVAQPAVTRHIGNLEDWLGVALFRRSGNRVELNDNGIAVSELVTSLFDRLEIGLRDISSRSGDSIVIAASFGITHLWLMPRITAMRDAALGSAISFVTSENYGDFDRGQVDFSIRFGDGNWPGKTTDLLFSETTYVIASPSFLNAHPELDPHNPVPGLRAEWLLEHGDPNNYGWTGWQEWLQHQGVESPIRSDRPTIQNYPTLLDMVHCGEGVALGFVGLDDHLVDSGELIRLGAPVHRPDVGYYLVSVLSQPEPLARRKLRQYLLSS